MFRAVWTATLLFGIFAAFAAVSQWDYEDMRMRECASAKPLPQGYDAARDVCVP